MAGAVLVSASLAARQSPPAQTPPPKPTPFPRGATPTPTPAATPDPAKQAASAGPLDLGTIDPRLAGISGYPGAEFLASYDAGKGQRYYLFGTNSTFAEAVSYYRGVLKQKGELVYDEPAIHQFDIGRFREESMAFPPSVTVKDYTWGGSAGYLNPKRGAQPTRFKTIIQIVPAS